MPAIHVIGVNLYYGTHGEGEPLLLIGGLGNDISDEKRSFSRSQESGV